MKNGFRYAENELIGLSHCVWLSQRAWAESNKLMVIVDFNSGRRAILCIRRRTKWNSMSIKRRNEWQSQSMGTALIAERPDKLICDKDFLINYTSEVCGRNKSAEA